MQDEVGAAFQRTQVHRRRRGRVADDRRWMGGSCLEVRHREQRVRRRLDPDEICAVRRRARLVELHEAEPPLPQHPHQHSGAVVGALREGDRLPGLEECEN
jgi:hypothetical protein